MEHTSLTSSAATSRQDRSAGRRRGARGVTQSGQQAAWRSASALTTPPPLGRAVGGRAPSRCGFRRTPPPNRPASGEGEPCDSRSRLLSRGASRQRASAATAWSTSSAMISATGCSAVTMPTDWPAITEPFSTSPSMTARRSAPAQKCSMSSCAASLFSSPAWKRSRVSAWWARKRLVPCVDQAAHRDDREPLVELDRWQRVARVGADEACLKFGMGDRFGRRRRSGCRAGRRRRPFPGSARIASPRPNPPATKTGTSRICGRISCASTVSETGPIWPPASEPSITSASAPERISRLRQHQRRSEGDQLGAAVLDRAHRGAGRDAAGQHDMADFGLAGRRGPGRRAAGAW